MAYKSVQEIIGAAQRKGFTFDIETLGLYEGQGMYSASWADWRTRDPKTYIFNVDDQLPAASYFGADGYNKLKQTDEFKLLAKNNSFDTYRKFGRDFIDQLKSHDVIAGHNLNFDFSFLYETFKKHPDIQQELQQTLWGTSDAEIEEIRQKAFPKAGSNVTAQEQAEALERYQKVKYQEGRLSAGHGKVGYHIKHEKFDQAYSSLLNYANEQKAAGRPVVMDTFTGMKLYAGLADQAGVIKWNSSKQVGARLEFLAEALGIDTSMGAHTALDVIYNQPLADVLGNGDLDRVAQASARNTAKNISGLSMGDLSESGQRLLNTLKFIEDDGKLAQQNYELAVKQAAFHHVYDNKVPVRTQDGRVPVYSKTKKFVKEAGKKGKYVDHEPTINSLLGFYAKKYDSINPEGGLDLDEARGIFKSAVESYGSKPRQAAEEMLYNQSKGIKDYVIAGIKEKFKPVKRIPHSTSDFGAASLKEAIFSKKTLKVGAYAAGAVALATMYSSLTNGYKAPEAKRISSDDDDYNTIEGLYHGGVAEQMRHQLTDFGSGFKDFLMAGLRGIKKVGTALPTIAGEAVKGLAHEVKEYPMLTAGMGVWGFASGYQKGKEEKHVRVGAFMRNIALDMADDALIFGAPAMFGEAVHSNTAFQSIVKALESKPAKMGAVSLFGFTMGKIAGEIFGSMGGKIPSKDDFYNTIEGLHPGGGVNKAKTRELTDFGSGYQGPNPQLQPDYNNAKDVYSYQWMRASSIGLSEEELYKQVTSGKENTSEYVAASANAGTALHEYLQGLEAQQGTARDAERLVVNRQHQITGHIDMITDKGIGDYKTVTTGIFNEIAKKGAPKPTHFAQVQFYMGQTGIDKGYIQYVNRDNINQQKTYYINFDPQYYSNLMGKVERVRARVNMDLEAGRLSKRSLPMTASPERLENDASHGETLEERAAKVDEYRRTFKEEMDYVRSVKRGMPTQGEGYERVKQKRERQFGSTQGIGLEVWNHRNKHYQM